MTGYELVDAIASYNSAGGTFFTMWLSTLSAYAITAYIAGRETSLPFRFSGLTLCTCLRHGH